jgi:integrase
MDKDTMKAFKKLFEKLLNNIHRLVFFSPFTKYKVINNNYENYVLRQFLAELNIEQITIHGLRHTHASILLYEGVNVSYVSSRLGHGEIETTFNNYHVIKELEERDLMKTADIFEKMLR